MQKDRIILRTHGLHNEKETGLVILPKSFYVKVDIEENGDFFVEFFDANEEHLFDVGSSVNGKVIGQPIQDNIKNTEIWMAEQIVDMLAEHLLDEQKPTFNTEAALDQWQAWASHAFRDCDVEWNHKNEEQHG